MVAIITEESHPKIWAAFQLIDADSGIEDDGRAGEFEVPKEWEPHLQEIETALAELTKEEYEGLCCGEHETEIVPIANRSLALRKANYLFADYFESFTAEAHKVDFNIPIA